MTTVRPAGAKFFCAAAQTTPWRDQSIGRVRKLLDMSATSGTPSGAVGGAGNSTPCTVSLSQ